MYQPESRRRKDTRKTVNTKQRQCSTPSRMAVIIYYYIVYKYKATTWYITGFPSKMSGRNLPLYFFFFFNLTFSRWTSSLPSCLWSLRILPSLPGSRLTIFYRDVSPALLQLNQLWRAPRTTMVDPKVSLRCAFYEPVSRNATGMFALQGQIYGIIPEAAPCLHHPTQLRSFECRRNLYRLSNLSW